MKNIFIACFVFCAIQTVAQPTPEQKEIIEQVWKPFIQAYNELNTDAYMSLHSKDVVRVSRDDGSVKGFAEYAAAKANSDQSAKLNKFQHKIELRFNEHWSNGTQAYQVGIYKSQSIKPSGNNLTFYGRFHVTLRKENGVWKILVDADSSEGGTVTDKEFLAARPME